VAECFVFPMSAAQKQLWFLDQLQPGDAFYNLSGVVRLGGRLDVGALEQSLAELVLRHESLRTTFALLEEQPSQVVTSELEVPLQRVDLMARTPAERAEELERLTGEEARKPFDLSQGPLLRTTLVRLEDGEHVLLVTMHHIISDGWSLGVFTRELAALYDAHTTRTSHALPELAIQYPDFTCWQHERLASGELSAQVAYWREHLEGAPALLALPTDLPRPAVQTFEGRSIPFLLDRELTRELEALGLRCGNATLFMVLLAAFGTLLHRYSGEETVVIGSPISGRSRPETEPLIGLFVNTLPLRLDFTGNPRFTELLAAVRETVLGALAHQELPFAMLVEELNPARNPSHNPLFQVLFAFQNTPSATHTLRGLSVAFEERSTSARFDLTLEVAEHPSGYQARLEYNTALFEEATARRMVEHYLRLLQELRSAPARAVSEARMLSEEEQHRLLHAWNDTRTEAPAPRCLHQLLEERAALQPGAVALVDGERVLSYGELDARANQVAHFLRARGVGPETVVGLHAARTWSGVVGILGILKAGAAYLPVDPSHPLERRRRMLEDAGCPVVLCTGAEPLPGPAVSIELDAQWPLIARESPRKPDVRVSEDNLAYVIYTSGTTGRSKGVGVSHRGICNLARAQIRAFDVTPDSRVLQFASWSFDASVSELAMALGSGAALHLPGADATALGSRLLDVLRAQAITHVTLPPSLLAVLPPCELPALRALIVAGERCPPELVARWGQGRRFFNAYGPTESSVCATLTRCEPADRHVSIGRPIDNVRVYLLDKHLRPVPPGARGELYIGGMGVARGYVGNPALTAERFIPDPHARTPGARLYRTGDVARYLPGGDIEFLGRGDSQLKIRGHRVEPGEVEAALREHPGVREAAVVDVERQPGSVQLVAFVVPDKDLLSNPSALSTFLDERLPAYMRPSRIHFLETALPLTANGKVARNVLRAQAAAHAEAPRQELVTARNSVEERLVRVFRAVLKRDEVGIHDNFFDLGGDSILSIQVAAQAKLLGLLVTPRQLFQHQTIEQLAPRVEEHAALPPEPERARGTAPLTPLQHWFFEDEHAPLHHFNQSLLLEVPEALEPETLAEALRQLMRHHDALRSRFRRTDSGWRQSYEEAEASPAFEMRDLSPLPASRQDEAMEKAVQDIQTALDIEHGPLLGAVLFHTGPGRSRHLLLVAHHLVVDGVSWRILAEDLETALHQLQQGTPVVLPPRTATFKQWAEHLSRQTRASAPHEELAYWEQLAREAPARLPMDHARGDNTYGAARSLTVTLDEQETEHLLREAPKAYHTTVQELLLTALADTVATWAHTPRVLLDIESHGREATDEGLDVSRTVGWFTTLYPLLLRVEHGEPGPLLKSIKEQFRGVPGGGLRYLALRHLSPEEEVRARLGALRTPDIGFNYLGHMEMAGTRAAPLLQLSTRQYGELDVDPRRRRQHLWDVVASIQHGRLHVEWTYCPHFHRDETMVSLAEGLLEGLKELLRHCLQPTAGGWTPSDFPQARLSQQLLDSFIHHLTES